MNPRDLLLKELRGEAIGTITNQSSNEETFQNQTLRPILKLQNVLFVAFIVFLNKKNVPHTASQYIDLL